MPIAVSVAMTGALTACAESSNETETAAPGAASAPARCDGDSAIKVPAGFCATIFADNLGHARHLAVSARGDVYVNTWSSMYNKMTNAPGGFVVSLRDADRDGRAETVQRFGTMFQAGKPGGGTGIAVSGDSLYVEVDNKIVRYALTADGVAPKTEPVDVVTGLPQDGDHPMHPFVIAPDGSLYMTSGSASNSCQQKNRTLESPGQRPCRELETRAGIWRYDANKTGQAFSPRERYATGLRNAEALGIHPGDAALYAAVHGRDQLSDNWPKAFTVEQQNELPAEIFARVREGADFGWPYCYYDAGQRKQLLAPEYGGDGKTEGECAMKDKPDVAFPAHWAPDALAFYSATGFPAKYQGGAFVSFHGSWNRKPAQAGYLVAFVPFADGKPTGTYEEFASGFAGPRNPENPDQAAHRPMGLATGPDGALYVSDDVNGRIWRITYSGN
jgi:glucose/arabinose dehydrogenase